MLQLRVRMLQIKILHVSTETWCSQINKYVWKKKEGNLGSRRQGRMPCDDRGRDWSYLARSQGMPRIADSCQKLAERHETDSSSEPLLLLLSHFSRVRLYIRPHGLQPTRLLRPWDFPGKSTGVGCHCLLRVWAPKEEPTSQHLDIRVWDGQCLLF